MLTVDEWVELVEDKLLQRIVKEAGIDPQKPLYEGGREAYEWLRTHAFQYLQGTSLKYGEALQHVRYVIAVAHRHATVYAGVKESWL